MFRSLNHIYAQIINDDNGITLLQANSLELKTTKTQTKTSIAEEVGPSRVDTRSPEEVSQAAASARADAAQGDPAAPPPDTSE